MGKPRLRDAAELHRLLGNRAGVMILMRETKPSEGQEGRLVSPLILESSLLFSGGKKKSAANQGQRNELFHFLVQGDETK